MENALNKLLQGFHNGDTDGSIFEEKQKLEGTNATISFLGTHVIHVIDAIETIEIKLTIQLSTSRLHLILFIFGS